MQSLKVTYGNFFPDVDEKPVSHRELSDQYEWVYRDASEHTECFRYIV